MQNREYTKGTNCCPPPLRMIDCTTAVLFQLVTSPRPNVLFVFSTNNSPGYQVPWPLHKTRYKHVDSLEIPRLGSLPFKVV